MRKDVKLGFAIGGVLLAVVVVYVLVVPNNGEKRGANLAGGDTASNVTTSDATASNGAADASAGSPTESAASDTAVADNTTEQPAGAHTDAQPNVAAAVDSNASSGETRADASSANRQGLDWDKLLNEGAELPSMMNPANGAAGATAATNAPTTAPSVATAAEVSAAAGVSSSASTATPEVAAANEPVSLGSDATMMATGPATTPSAATTLTGRTHIVRPGETLSSIAAAAYGDARFYPYIKRANPNLDERKLKVGTVIVLPDASQVHGRTAATNGSTAPLNSAREYRVQPGDSLYRISIKLYGNPSQADRIYELNKTTIGANPAALKVNTVLKLPEATANASR